ncbi:MAG: phosphoribosyltransferase family protein [Nitrososphaeraceae archaeon]
MFESILNKFQLRFKNREWAANVLAESLKDVIRKEKISSKEIVVLGIPRGGVITANVIAQKLKASFDILIPRKLGAPHNQELGIGAVMEDGTTYLNKDIIMALKISSEYIDQVKSEQIDEIKRRRSLYRNKNDDNTSLTYNTIDNTKTAILTDDGAATGATLIAAARWLKNKNYSPKQIIIATPVAPKDIVSSLKKESDHVVIILTPSNSSFRSVGQYYQEFNPVTDEQVIEIMKARNIL